MSYEDIDNETDRVYEEARDSGELQERKRLEQVLADTIVCEECFGVYKRGENHVHDFSWDDERPVDSGRRRRRFDFGE